MISLSVRLDHINESSLYQRRSVARRRRNLGLRPENEDDDDILM